MAKTRAQRKAEKVNRRNREFARQEAADEKVKQNPTPEKMCQDGKYTDRRINVKVEKFDGFTVTSWTDPRITAKTPDSRTRQYNALADERQAEDDMYGFGFREYYPVNNCVLDYDFESRKGYENYVRWNLTVEGMTQKMERAGQSVTDETSLETAFPSIGVSKIDLRNPENFEYLDMCCELVSRMRYGEISEVHARLYAALFIEPFKKSAA